MKNLKNRDQRGFAPNYKSFETITEETGTKRQQPLV